MLALPHLSSSDIGKLEHLSRLLFLLDPCNFFWFSPRAISSRLAWSSLENFHFKFLLDCILRIAVIRSDWMSNTVCFPGLARSKSLLTEFLRVEIFEANFAWTSFEVFPRICRPGCRELSSGGPWRVRFSNSNIV